MAYLPIFKVGDYNDLRSNGVVQSYHVIFILSRAPVETKIEKVVASEAEPRWSADRPLHLC